MVIDYEQERKDWINQRPSKDNADWDKAEEEALLKICPFLQQKCIGGRCQAWNPHDTDFGWRCCTICHYWPRKDAIKHAEYSVRTQEGQGKP